MHAVYEVDRASLGKLIADLEALPKRYIRPALKHSVKAASEETRKIARVLAPKGKGNLRRSLIVRQVPAKGRNGTITAVVGPRYKYYADGSNPGKYGHLVERGTVPHKIFPKNKKVLMWKGKTAGQKVSFDPARGVTVTPTGRMKRFTAFALHVNHPGSRDRNYLRIAGRISTPAATRAFIRELQARYTKGLAKETFRA